MAVRKALAGGAQPLGRTLANPKPGTRSSLTAGQVARMLQVSEAQVLRWLASGDLKGSKSGGVWHVSRRQLERFLDAHANIPKA